MFRKAIQGEIKISTENGETRTLRCAPDWGETAINGDHLWVSTNASGDLCYVGESECSKQGPRLCCPICKITAHTGCIGILIDKIKFHCRPTFKDVGVRQYREVSFLIRLFLPPLILVMMNGSHHHQISFRIMMFQGRRMMMSCDHNKIAVLISFLIFPFCPIQWLADFYRNICPLLMMFLHHVPESWS